MRYGSQHLSIIVGHTNKSPGAYSSQLKTTEYAYMSEFASLLKLEVMRFECSASIHFRDDGGISGAYLRALSNGPACIIELHFNAFNGIVSGCETLFSEKGDDVGVRERLFAQKIQNAMVSALDNQDRGLKHRVSKGERGFFNLSRVSSVPSILIEPFFGDNSKDAKNFHAKRSLVAASLAKTFKEFVDGN